MLAIDVVYGLAIGLSLGLTGAGGSIITVPILLYLVGMSVHDATGTSLIIVGLGALAGAFQYFQKKLVHWRIAIVFALSGIVAAFAGSYLNAVTPGVAIMYIFTAIMLVVGTMMIVKSKKDGGHESEKVPNIKSLGEGGAKGWTELVLTSLLIGLMTGFLGVGGGFLIVPALVLILKFPIKHAIGTSLMIISLNSLWGILARLFGLGSINFGPVMWLIVLGTVVGIVIGCFLAGKIKGKALTLGFAYFVIAIAVYMALKTTGILHF